VTPTQPDSEQVLAANISYHTALAAEYDATQPHFRPENVARVTSIVERMAAETGGGSLVDLGCGTGFVITIAKHHFRRVVGVDATDAMLERVDTTGGNVELIRARTEDVPLPDGEFDACTAYGYLHHLYDLRLTFAEAARLLRPGGLFYSDQDPNHYYWAALSALGNRDDLSGFVAREVDAVLESDTLVAEETNLAPEEVRLAEFQKMTLDGFRAEDVARLLRDSGFSSVTYSYEWYLGQGSVLHGLGDEAAGTVERYLRDALPASKHLFKYVSFAAVR
jgi:ubiquinone/menaquinone biosynthesis C-methylase UbiE